MKRFSKILALGLATTMMGSVLIGCGKTEKPHEAPADEPGTEEVAYEEESEEQPVTLRTVSQFGGTDPAAAVYQAILEDFRADNPKITVEDESVTVDEAWKAKVATDFAAGNEPDVIFTYTGIDAKVMIEQGKIVSLEEIREKFPDYASNISEGILNSVQEFDGNTYAVPVRGFYEGLFINKPIFEAYGLDLPTDWEKLEIAVQVLRENDIVPIAATLGERPDYWIEHLILSQGGIKVHRNQDMAAVKEDWVAGLGHFKTLYDMGAFPEDTNTASNDVMTELFGKGDAAMLLDGNWAIGTFDNPDDVTVIPVPVVPGGVADPSDIIGGFPAGWYITRKAWEDPAKRSAAVKYITAMTSTESIEAFVTEGSASVAADGLAMQANAASMDYPIHSWLAESAWDKLLSEIPGIATGETDISSLVDQVIKLNQD